MASLQQQLQAHRGHRHHHHRGGDSDGTTTVQSSITVESDNQVDIKA